jgi:hypothetical protein
MSFSTFILRTLITKNSSRLLYSSIDYTRRSTILNSKLSSTLHLRSSQKTNKVLVEFDEISSSLMKYRSSKFDEISFIKIWWDTVIRLDIKCDEIWRDTFRQIWWDVAYQRWWNVARIKFDESLSSCLMSRSRQSIRHFEKNRVRQSNIDDEMIKHDYENEFTEIFLQEKNLKSHFSIASHISKQDAINQVISIFATNRIFWEKRL